jgi:hypothetical protein
MGWGYLGREEGEGGRPGIPLEPLLHLLQAEATIAHPGRGNPVVLNRDGRHLSLAEINIPRLQQLGQGKEIDLSQAQAQSGKVGGGFPYHLNPFVPYFLQIVA